MHNVFLSYPFDPDDLETRRLLGYLDTVFRAQGWRTVTGEALGGGGLTDEVRDRIAGADALVSILAPRGEPRGDGTRAASGWVRDELQHARSISKPCIGIVFQGVDPGGGMFAERERIVYDPAAPAMAILKLVATLGLWKERLGRPLKIRLEPGDLTNRLRFDGNARCEARITRGGEVLSDWQAVRVSPQVGGVFVDLRAPQDALIQLRAQVGGESWYSVESQQWVHVPLEKQP